MLARLLLILAAVAIIAPADTVFSTFGPGSSYISNSGWLIGGIQFGGTLTTEEAALSFTPTANYALDQLDVAVLRESGNGPLDLYITSGSTIGNPIESFQITTIDSSPGIYSVLSVVRPVLNAGTEYWLVLTADPTAANFAWLVSANGDKAASASITSSPVWSYATTQQAPAFDVQGTPLNPVPEPSSLSLLSWIALAACFTARRLIRTAAHKRPDKPNFRSNATASSGLPLLKTSPPA